MTTHLILDSRQRAMLAEMGVRVWLPETSVTQAALVEGVQNVALQPAREVAAATLPIRKEPPLRLPVLNSPPMQATNKRVRYVIGNMPNSAERHDYILLGEPCTGEAEKLLTSMLRVLKGKIFVAQTMTAQDDDLQLADQLQALPAKAILALGPHAAKALIDEASQAMPFGKLRGTLHRVDGVQCPIIVTYHPLQLLRQPLAKAQAWLDLKLAMKALK